MRAVPDNRRFDGAFLLWLLPRNVRNRPKPLQEKVTDED
jgi:hypothetical protein